MPRAERSRSCSPSDSSSRSCSPGSVCSLSILFICHLLQPRVDLILKTSDGFTNFIVNQILIGKNEHSTRGPNSRQHNSNNILHSQLCIWCTIMYEDWISYVQTLGPETAVKQSLKVLEIPPVWRITDKAHTFHTKPKKLNLTFGAGGDWSVLNSICALSAGDREASRTHLWISLMSRIKRGQPDLATTGAKGRTLRAHLKRNTKLVR
jgi:hypothetical protein